MQAKRIRALEQKNQSLQRDIRILRKQVRGAVKYHKKVTILRARLARANKAKRALKVKFQQAKVAKAQRARRFRTIKLAKPIEGGTRKLPKFRRKRRRAKRPIRRREPKPRTHLKFVPGTGGRMVQLIAPVSYVDWSQRLARFKASRDYKFIIANFPRATYSVSGNPGPTFRSLDAALNYFDERYMRERMITERWSERALDNFFAHIIVYGIKDDYTTPKTVIRKWKKPNRTGRN